MKISIAVLVLFVAIFFSYQTPSMALLSAFSTPTVCKLFPNLPFCNNPPSQDNGSSGSTASTESSAGSGPTTADTLKPSNETVPN
ncbi:uncharacterized protein LOC108138480 [Drosophila elegans]|uniref:uncharacterized protein LOC108138480 n=1 Tax=Drosophila elegans TaxID=30023 RepID=UPI0007E5E421|nr:uncharacterized protein LOC108138480 [Drosophila elegans]